MKDLINRLIAQGLTEDKAHTALTTVVSWVEEHYPVAGALAGNWVRNHSDSNTEA